MKENVEYSYSVSETNYVYDNDGNLVDANGYSIRLNINVDELVDSNGDPVTIDSLSDLKDEFMAKYNIEYDMENGELSIEDIQSGEIVTLETNIDASGNHRMGLLDDLDESASSEAKAQALKAKLELLKKMGFTNVSVTHDYYTIIKNKAYVAKSVEASIGTLSDVWSTIVYDSDKGGYLLPDGRLITKTDTGFAIKDGDGNVTNLTETEFEELLKKFGCTQENIDNIKKGLNDSSKANDESVLVSDSSITSSYSESTYEYDSRGRKKGATKTRGSSTWDIEEQLLLSTSETISEMGIIAGNVVELSSHEKSTNYNYSFDEANPRELLSYTETETYTYSGYDSTGKCIAKKGFSVSKTKKRLTTTTPPKYNYIFKKKEPFFIPPIFPIFPIKPLFPLKPIAPIKPILLIKPILQIKPIIAIKPIKPIISIKPIIKLKPIQPIIPINPFPFIPGLIMPYIPPILPIIPIDLFPWVIQNVRDETPKSPESFETEHGETVTWGEPPEQTENGDVWTSNEYVTTSETWTEIIYTEILEGSGEFVVKARIEIGMSHNFVFDQETGALDKDASTTTYNHRIVVNDYNAVTGLLEDAYLGDYDPSKAGQTGIELHGKEVDYDEDGFARTNYGYSDTYSGIHDREDESTLWDENLDPETNASGKWESRNYNIQYFAIFYGKAEVIYEGYQKVSFSDTSIIDVAQGKLSDGSSLGDVIQNAEESYISNVEIVSVTKKQNGGYEVKLKIEGQEVTITLDPDTYECDEEVEITVDGVTKKVRVKFKLKETETEGEYELEESTLQTWDITNGDWVQRYQDLLENGYYEYKDANGATQTVYIESIHIDDGTIEGKTISFLDAKGNMDVNAFNDFKNSFSEEEWIALLSGKPIYHLDGEFDGAPTVEEFLSQETDEDGNVIFSSGGEEVYRLEKNDDGTYNVQEKDEDGNWTNVKDEKGQDVVITADEEKTVTFGDGVKVSVIMTGDPENPSRFMMSKTLENTYTTEITNNGNILIKDQNGDVVYRLKKEMVNGKCTYVIQQKDNNGNWQNVLNSNGFSIVIDPSDPLQKEIDLGNGLKIKITGSQDGSGQPKIEITNGFSAEEILSQLTAEELLKAARGEEVSITITKDGKSYKVTATFKKGTVSYTTYNVDTMTWNTDTMFFENYDMTAEELAEKMSENEFKLGIEQVEVDKMSVTIETGSTFYDRDEKGRLKGARKAVGQSWTYYLGRTGEQTENYRSDIMQGNFDLNENKNAPHINENSNMSGLEENDENPSNFESPLGIGLIDPDSQFESDDSHDTEFVFNNESNVPHKAKKLNSDTIVVDGYAKVIVIKGKLVDLEGASVRMKTNVSLKVVNGKDGYESHFSESTNFTMNVYHNEYNERGDITGGTSFNLAETRKGIMTYEDFLKIDENSSHSKLFLDNNSWSGFSCPLLTENGNSITLKEFMNILRRVLSVNADEELAKALLMEGKFKFKNEDGDEEIYILNMPENEDILSRSFTVQKLENIAGQNKVIESLDVSFNYNYTEFKRGMTVVLSRTEYDYNRKTGTQTHQEASGFNVSLSERGEHHAFYGLEELEMEVDQSTGDINFKDSEGNILYILELNSDGTYSLKDSQGNVIKDKDGNDIVVSPGQDGEFTFTGPNDEEIILKVPGESGEVASIARNRKFFYHPVTDEKIYWDESDMDFMGESISWTETTFIKVKGNWVVEDRHERTLSYGTRDNSDKADQKVTETTRTTHHAYDDEGRLTADGSYIESESKVWEQDLGQYQGSGGVYPPDMVDALGNEVTDINGNWNGKSKSPDGRDAVITSYSESTNKLFIKDGQLETKDSTTETKMMPQVVVDDSGVMIQAEGYDYYIHGYYFSEEEIQEFLAKLEGPHTFNLNSPKERALALFLQELGELLDGQNWWNESVDGISYQQYVNEELPLGDHLSLDFKITESSKLNAYIDELLRKAKVDMSVNPPKFVDMYDYYYNGVYFSASDFQALYDANGNYTLNLDSARGRAMAQFLLDIANEIPGENWIGESVDGTEYQQYVGNDLPSSGILTFKFEESEQETLNAILESYIGTHFDKVLKPQIGNIKIYVEYTNASGETIRKYMSVEELLDKGFTLEDLKNLFNEKKVENLHGTFTPVIHTSKKQSSEVTTEISHTENFFDIFVNLSSSRNSTFSLTILSASKIGKELPSGVSTPSESDAIKMTEDGDYIMSEGSSVTWSEMAWNPDTERDEMQTMWKISDNTSYSWLANYVYNSETNSWSTDEAITKTHTRKDWEYDKDGRLIGARSLSTNFTVALRDLASSVTIGNKTYEPENAGDSVRIEVSSSITETTQEMVCGELRDHIINVLSTSYNFIDFDVDEDGNIKPNQKQKVETTFRCSVQEISYNETNGEIDAEKTTKYGFGITYLSRKGQGFTDIIEASVAAQNSENIINENNDESLMQETEATHREWTYYNHQVVNGKLIESEMTLKQSLSADPLLSDCVEVLDKNGESLEFYDDNGNKIDNLNQLIKDGKWTGEDTKRFLLALLAGIEVDENGMAKFDIEYNGQTISLYFKLADVRISLETDTPDPEQPKDVRVIDKATRFPFLHGGIVRTFDFRSFMLRTSIAKEKELLTIDKFKELLEKMVDLEVTDNASNEERQKALEKILNDFMAGALNAEPVVVLGENTKINGKQYLAGEEVKLSDLPSWVQAALNGNNPNCSISEDGTLTNTETGETFKISGIKVFDPQTRTYKDYDPSQAKDEGPLASQSVKIRMSTQTIEIESNNRSITISYKAPIVNEYGQTIGWRSGSGTMNYEDDGDNMIDEDFSELVSNLDNIDNLNGDSVNEFENAFYSELDSLVEDVLVNKGVIGEEGEDKFTGYTKNRETNKIVNGKKVVMHAYSETRNYKRDGYYHYNQETDTLEYVDSDDEDSKIVVTVTVVTTDNMYDEFGHLIGAEKKSVSLTYNYGGKGEDSVDFDMNKWRNSINELNEILSKALVLFELNQSQLDELFSNGFTFHKGKKIVANYFDESMKHIASVTVSLIEIEIFKGQAKDMDETAFIMANERDAVMNDSEINIQIPFFIPGFYGFGFMGGVPFWGSYTIPIKVKKKHVTQKTRLTKKDTKRERDSDGRLMSQKSTSRWIVTSIAEDDYDHDNLMSDTEPDHRYLYNPKTGEKLEKGDVMVFEEGWSEDEYEIIGNQGKLVSTHSESTNYDPGHYAEGNDDEGYEFIYKGEWTETIKDTYYNYDNITGQLLGASGSETAKTYGKNDGHIDLVGADGVNAKPGDTICKSITFITHEYRVINGEAKMDRSYGVTYNGEEEQIDNKNSNEGLYYQDEYGNWKSYKDLEVNIDGVDGKTIGDLNLTPEQLAKLLLEGEVQLKDGTVIKLKNPNVELYGEVDNGSGGTAYLKIDKSNTDNLVKLLTGQQGYLNIEIPIPVVSGWGFTIKMIPIPIPTKLKRDMHYEKSTRERVTFTETHYFYDSQGTIMGKREYKKTITTEVVPEASEFPEEGVDIEPSYADGEDYVVDSAPLETEERSQGVSNQGVSNRQKRLEERMKEKWDELQRDSSFNLDERFNENKKYAQDSVTIMKSIIPEFIGQGHAVLMALPSSNEVGKTMANNIYAVFGGNNLQQKKYFYDTFLSAFPQIMAFDYLYGSKFLLAPDGDNLKSSDNRDYSNVEGIKYTDNGERYVESEEYVVNDYTVINGKVVLKSSTSNTYTYGGIQTLQDKGYNDGKVTHGATYVAYKYNDDGMIVGVKDYFDITTVTATCEPPPNGYNHSVDEDIEDIEEELAELDQQLEDLENGRNKSQEELEEFTNDLQNTDVLEGIIPTSQTQAQNNLSELSYETINTYAGVQGKSLYDVQKLVFEGSLYNANAFMNVNLLKFTDVTKNYLNNLAINFSNLISQIMISSAYLRQIRLISGEADGQMQIPTGDQMFIAVIRNLIQLPGSLLDEILNADYMARKEKLLDKKKALEEKKKELQEKKAKAEQLVNDPSVVQVIVKEKTWKVVYGQAVEDQVTTKTYTRNLELLITDWETPPQDVPQMQESILDPGTLQIINQDLNLIDPNYTNLHRALIDGSEESEEQEGTQSQQYQIDPSLLSMRDYFWPHFELTHFADFSSVLTMDPDAFVPEVPQGETERSWDVDVTTTFETKTEKNVYRHGVIVTKIFVSGERITVKDDVSSIDEARRKAAENDALLTARKSNGKPDYDARQDYISNYLVESEVVEGPVYETIKGRVVEIWGILWRDTTTGDLYMDDVTEMEIEIFNDETGEYETIYLSELDAASRDVLIDEIVSYLRELINDSNNISDHTISLKIGNREITIDITKVKIEFSISMNEGESVRVRVHNGYILASNTKEEENYINWQNVTGNEFFLALIISALTGVPVKATGASKDGGDVNLDELKDGLEKGVDEKDSDEGAIKYEDVWPREVDDEDTSSEDLVPGEFDTDYSGEHAIPPEYVEDGDVKYKVEGPVIDPFDEIEKEKILLEKEMLESIYDKELDNPVKQFRDGSLNYTNCNFATGFGGMFEKVLDMGGGEMHLMSAPIPASGGVPGMRMPMLMPLSFNLSSAPLSVYQMFNKWSALHPRGFMDITLAQVIRKPREGGKIDNLTIGYGDGSEDIGSLDCDVWDYEQASKLLGMDGEELFNGLLSDNGVGCDSEKKNVLVKSGDKIETETRTYSDYDENGNLISQTTTTNSKTYDKDGVMVSESNGYNYSISINGKMCEVYSQTVTYGLNITENWTTNDEGFKYLGDPTYSKSKSYNSTSKTYDDNGSLIAVYSENWSISADVESADQEVDWQRAYELLDNEALTGEDKNKKEVSIGINDLTNEEMDHLGKHGWFEREGIKYYKNSDIGGDGEYPKITSFSYTRKDEVVMNGKIVETNRSRSIMVSYDEEDVISDGVKDILVKENFKNSEELAEFLKENEDITIIIDGKEYKGADFFKSDGTLNEELKEILEKLFNAYKKERTIYARQDDKNREADPTRTETIKSEDGRTETVKTFDENGVRISEVTTTYDENGHVSVYEEEFFDENGVIMERTEEWYYSKDILRKREITKYDIDGNKTSNEKWLYKDNKVTSHILEKFDENGKTKYVFKESFGDNGNPVFKSETFFRDGIKIHFIQISYDYDGLAAYKSEYVYDENGRIMKKFYERYNRKNEVTETEEKYADGYTESDVEEYLKGEDKALPWDGIQFAVKTMSGNIQVTKHDYEYAWDGTDTPFIIADNQTVTTAYVRDATRFDYFDPQTNERIVYTDDGGSIARDSEGNPIHTRPQITTSNGKATERRELRNDMLLTAWQKNYQITYNQQQADKYPNEDTDKVKVNGNTIVADDGCVISYNEQLDYRYDSQERLIHVRGGVSFVATYNMNPSQDAVMDENGKIKEYNEDKHGSIESPKDLEAYIKVAEDIKTLNEGGEIEDERLKEHYDMFLTVLDLSNVDWDEFNKWLEDGSPEPEEESSGWLEDIVSGLTDSLSGVIQTIGEDEIEKIEKFIKLKAAIEEFKRLIGKGVLILKVKGSDTIIKDISDIDFEDLNKYDIYYKTRDGMTYNVECKHGKVQMTMAGYDSMDAYIDDLRDREKNALEGKTSNGYQTGTYSGRTNDEGERLSLFQYAESMGAYQGTYDKAQGMEDDLSDFEEYLKGLNSNKGGEFVKTGDIILTNVEFRISVEYKIIKGMPVSMDESTLSISQPVSIVRNIADYRVVKADGDDVLAGVDLTDEQLQQLMNDEDGIITIIVNGEEVDVYIEIAFLTAEADTVLGDKDPFDYLDSEGVRVVRSCDDSWNNLQYEDKKSLIFAGGSITPAEFKVNGKVLDASSLSLKDLAAIIDMDWDSYGEIGSSAFFIENGKLVIKEVTEGNKKDVIGLDEIKITVKMTATNGGREKESVMEVSLAALIYADRKHTKVKDTDFMNWSKHLAYFLLSGNTWLEGGGECRRGSR
ncbi:hypothetical protein BVX93_00090 [bacterium B13(2017)]|nr:hypothetical protein BVX93_00090 [bacterium B13(2017)]